MVNFLIREQKAVKYMWYCAGQEPTFIELHVFGGKRWVQLRTPHTPQSLLKRHITLLVQSPNTLLIVSLQTMVNHEPIYHKVHSLDTFFQRAEAVIPEIQSPQLQHPGEDSRGMHIVYSR